MELKALGYIVFYIALLFSGSTNAATECNDFFKGVTESYENGHIKIQSTSRIKLIKEDGDLFMLTREQAELEAKSQLIAFMKDKKKYDIKINGLNVSRTCISPKYYFVTVEYIQSNQLSALSIKEKIKGSIQKAPTPKLKSSQ